MRNTLAFLLAFGLFPALSLADNAGDPRTAIAGLVPGLSADDVRPSEVDGLYEVAIGSQIVYVTKDQRYLFKGDIIDLKTNESLTEARRSGLRLKEMAELSDDQMIEFGPADARHTITVFTDVDCTYCRKLHREIKQINDEGIRVRYVFYPRFGPGSDSWVKAEAVWCSKDRQAALTAAKNGEEVKAAACPNPVAEQYALGNKIGVRGTPAILMEDGELLPGYVPAKQLAAYLDRE
jgi:thiol:disulfide interchange protein DsbC